MNRAFTLIELLVVIVIIGVLSTIGVIAYNEYSLDAKKQATIANWNSAIKFIENTFAQCKLKGSTAVIELSPTAGRIPCATTPATQASVNAMADTFMRYFLEKRFINPYNVNDEWVVRRGSGGETVDGRLRLDETVCNNNRPGNEMSIWYKVHDNSGQIARMKMQHWC
ncbi:MAG: prepilin-type N-terminal cleavage/methylation domain-containing protein [Pelagibacterales bacterium]|nr:prepilin-type N-terminal cleavage/methylation domain-containing protein [Pelagibacterales bacterium]